MGRLLQVLFQVGPSSESCPSFALPVRLGDGLDQESFLKFEALSYYVICIVQLVKSALLIFIS